MTEWNYPRPLIRHRPRCRGARGRPIGGSRKDSGPGPRTRGGTVSLGQGRRSVDLVVPISVTLGLSPNRSDQGQSGTHKVYQEQEHEVRVEKKERRTR